MNRLTRIFVAALLSIALLVVAVPAAHAGSLSKPQSARIVDGDWIGAALSWLSQLLGVPKPPAPRGERPKDGGVPTGGGGGGGFTGSCIDPDGCTIVWRPGQGATNSNSGGS